MHPGELADAVLLSVITESSQRLGKVSIMPAFHQGYEGAPEKLQIYYEVLLEAISKHRKN